MSQVFPVDRSLLNPKFDGYKLKGATDPYTQSLHALPAPGATQSTISSRGTKAPLSFEEVQSRIKHNHLAVSHVPGQFAYVDAARNLVIISLNQETGDVSFRQVYGLPQTLKSPETQNDGSSNDYPVPISLSPRLWLVSDGQQELHLIDLANGSTASPIASYEYATPMELESKPALRLHAARLVDNGALEAVVSHRVLLEQSSLTTAPSSAKTRPAYKTVFDVLGLSMSIPQHSTAGTEPVHVIWKRRGDSIPLSVEYDMEHGAYLMIASTGFSATGEPKAEYVPSEDEIAPIPRAGEKLDGETTSTTAPPPRPPPYSWTQTNDSVTVAFPVPSSTAASAIRVNISPKYLSLLVSAPDHPNFPIPRYLSKEWWGPVDASSSFWTWDREGERQKGETGPQTVGLLTLHLEKKDEGTRWPHIFHAVGTGSTAPEDVEVPETIDPSEMWHIRESLEKYTAALSEGRDASGLGLGTGVPSLGQGEYDEDVDTNAGNPIHLTWVPAEGPTATNRNRNLVFGD
ncbi:hypothetical protein FRC00_005576 [Tulasnella sp. 408]|nr:hypothetical protein FRC00_005576 [Tulasnella sp. 408]